jgi:hypothetical protein
MSSTIMSTAILSTKCPAVTLDKTRLEIKQIEVLIIQFSLSIPHEFSSEQGYGGADSISGSKQRHPLPTVNIRIYSLIIQAQLSYISLQSENLCKITERLIF